MEAGGGRERLDGVLGVSGDLPVASRGPRSRCGVAAARGSRLEVVDVDEPIV